MKQSIPRSPVWLVLTLVVFAGTFTATATGKLRIPKIDVRVQRLSEDGYRPAFRRAGGTQLVLVYFGKAHCGWSNLDWLPPVIEDIKVRLSKKAADMGRGFMAVGVALDWSPLEGLDHLAKMGLFDEVSAGYNWGNSAALKYMYQDMPGPAATPQLLILERTLQVPDSNSPAITYMVTGERVLARKVGAFEIRQWLNNGLPLPHP